MLPDLASEKGDKDREEARDYSRFDASRQYPVHKADTLPFKACKILTDTLNV